MKKIESESETRLDQSTKPSHIKVSSSARNIGVTFDSHINLEKHVVVKTAKQTSFTYRILQKYGTVYLKTKLRYLFILLFLLSFLFATHCCMGYNDRCIKDPYSHV